MKLSLSSFDYHLPKSRIAQSPANPREAAKLMAVDRVSDEIKHKHIADFPDLLRKGDVLVINNSKVFKARLLGLVKRVGYVSGRAELFLLRPVKNGVWTALCRPARKFVIGASFDIASDFSCDIVEKGESGLVTVRFDLTSDEVIHKANQYGHVPVPPYIKREPKEGEYQTAYAQKVGSVAAPTAGFHLTSSLLAKIKAKGVEIVEITLHVGIGTFMPIKTDRIEDHVMHGEWVEVSSKAADAINFAKKDHRRIIAVGTTTVRTLEGIYAKMGKLTAYTGDINLFIKPGFEFKLVDCLLTNFHLPKSTLLLLVSAFAGYEHMMHAYQTAIEKEYRFYSFGDAMFIS